MKPYGRSTGGIGLSQSLNQTELTSAAINMDGQITSPGALSCSVMRQAGSGGMVEKEEEGEEEEEKILRTDIRTIGPTDQRTDGMKETAS